METTVNPNCSAILVIEDDESIRAAIVELLQLEGFTVATAENGRRGMEVLQSLKRPCLILLDMMMPIMDGWEFLDVLRASPGVSMAALPVIITSAAGNAVETAARQAQGLVRKPIDFDLLLVAVRKYCNPAIG